MEANFLDIPEFSDERGSLFVVEEFTHIPFRIKRIYWIKNVPSNAHRGGECHKRLRQILVPVQGYFDVELDDGCKKTVYSLGNPRKGLLIEPHIWRTMRNFSDDAICLVLASESYDPQDMINDYNVFIKKYTNE